MSKYNFLIFIYLFSLTAAAIASLTGLNVQALYRVPFFNFRWIDIGILWIVASYFYGVGTNYTILRGGGALIVLSFVYLLFEAFQLLQTWGRNDLNYQLSGFICTLGFFIIIDLSTFRIDKDKIVFFLKFFALIGAVALIIVNMITFFSFITGRVIITDDNYRIGLNAEGQNESIYTTVILSYVYAFGLYFIQHQSKVWEKALFFLAIISIYLSLVYSFARGDMFTVASITMIYIVVFSKKVKQLFSQVFTVLGLAIAFYFIFGSTLREKGYDPVEKFTETVVFAFDVDNPDWDKGRTIPRGYALAAWRQNIWTGVGYDVLYHHGAPEEFGTAHNFILTSLFHRGILGTFIYLVILIMLFRNLIKLWFVLRNKSSYENDLFKLLIIASVFWLVPFWNQEVIWEKYSLSIEFMYLGLITNILLARSSQPSTRRPALQSPMLHMNS